MDRLLKTGGLLAQRNADCLADSELAANWNIVADWTKESRYDRKGKDQAEELISAIVDAAHGCSHGSSSAGKSAV